MACWKKVLARGTWSRGVLTLSDWSPFSYGPSYWHRRGRAYPSVCLPACLSLLLRVALGSKVDCDIGSEEERRPGRYSEILKFVIIWRRMFPLKMAVGGGSSCFSLFSLQGSDPMTSLEQIMSREWRNARQRPQSSPTATNSAISLRRRRADARELSYPAK